METYLGMDVVIYKIKQDTYLQIKAWKLIYKLTM